MNKIVFIVLGVIIAGIGFIALKPEKQAALALDSFAQCLAQKEVTMYGADWCPYCQNEKKLFGDSFRLVPYVECPADPQRCLQVGIKGYPTWVFPDGKKLAGEQGLEKLSQESGCQLPQ